MIYSAKVNNEELGENALIDKTDEDWVDMTKNSITYIESGMKREWRKRS